MQEIWIWSVDWDDPLEKEMATPSRMYCLENSIDREAWRLQSVGSPGVGHDWAHMHACTSLISHSASVTLAFFLAYCRSAHSHHWTFTLALFLCLECSSHRYSLGYSTSSSRSSRSHYKIFKIFKIKIWVSVNLTVWKRPTLTYHFKTATWPPPSLQNTINLSFFLFHSTYYCLKYKFTYLSFFFF